MTQTFNEAGAEGLTKSTEILVDIGTSKMIGASLQGLGGWRLIKASRPLKKMHHAQKHLKNFQQLDPNLTSDDVAKILEFVRQTGESVPTKHCGKQYTGAVEIGGKKVSVKVVESSGGIIKTGFVEK